MKATIERATLLKSLSHVQSVVERRNTIPILSNVLLDAREDGSLRLMATDLDLQVDESVPANVATAGATTVSAHTFFDIVRKLPEGSQVELSAADGKMQVVAGRARFNLSTERDSRLSNIPAPTVVHSDSDCGSGVVFGKTFHLIHATQQFRRQTVSLSDEVKLDTFLMKLIDFISLEN